MILTRNNLRGLGQWNWVTDYEAYNAGYWQDDATGAVWYGDQYTLPPGYTAPIAAAPTIPAGRYSWMLDPMGSPEMVWYNIDTGVALQVGQIPPDDMLYGPLANGSFYRLNSPEYQAAIDANIAAQGGFFQALMEALPGIMLIAGAGMAISSFLSSSITTAATEASALQAATEQAAIDQAALSYPAIDIPVYAEPITAPVVELTYPAIDVPAVSPTVDWITPADIAPAPYELPPDLVYPEIDVPVYAEPITAPIDVTQTIVNQAVENIAPPAPELTYPEINVPAVGDPVIAPELVYPEVNVPATGDPVSTATAGAATTPPVLPKIGSPSWMDLLKAAAPVASASTGILSLLARVLGTGSTQTPYTGVRINPATGQPYPINPATGQPYDPATGLPVDVGAGNAQSILPVLLIGGAILLAMR